MTKTIKISSLPEFDLAEHLKTNEDVANYLTVVLEEHDPAELAHALGVIARACSAGIKHRGESRTTPYTNKAFTRRT